MIIITKRRGRKRMQIFWHRFSKNQFSVYTIIAIPRIFFAPPTRNVEGSLFWRRRNCLFRMLRFIMLFQAIIIRHRRLANCAHYFQARILSILLRTCLLFLLQSFRAFFLCFNFLIATSHGLFIIYT